MTFKQHRNLTKWILYITIIFWLVESTYFGWGNDTMTRGHEICDDLVRIGTFVWIFLYFRLISRVVDALIDDN